MTLLGEFFKSPNRVFFYRQSCKCDLLLSVIRGMKNEKRICSISLLRL